MKLASRWLGAAVIALVCTGGLACDDAGVDESDAAASARDAAAGAGGTVAIGKDASATGGLGGGAASVDAAGGGAGGRDGGAGANQGDASVADAGARSPSGQIDVLLVIDNSNSMAEEQDAIGPAFGELVKALRALPGGLPDLHVGVISTDVGAGPTVLPGNPACNRRGRVGGDRGELLVKDGCGLDGVASRFLIVSNGEASKNFNGRLEDLVGCLAKIGTGGCGFEHQLLATRLALDGVTNPLNSGFVRDEADLLIVIVTDEDDCSTDPNSTELFSALASDYANASANLRCAYEGHRRNGQRLPLSTKILAPLAEMSAAPGGNGKRDLLPVSDLVDALKRRKSSHRRLLVTAIAGWTGVGGSYAIDDIEFAGHSLLDLHPVCTSTTGSAAPALRIKQFVDAFGPRGRLESICDPDWKAKFARVGELVRSAP